eukprot:scaffold206124_cov25-Tisochrysis_lutea.AAC.1
MLIVEEAETFNVPLLLQHVRTRFGVAGWLGWDGLLPLLRANLKMITPNTAFASASHVDGGMK